MYSLENSISLLSSYKEAPKNQKKELTVFPIRVDTWVLEAIENEAERHPEFENRCELVRAHLRTLAMTLREGDKNER